LKFSIHKWGSLALGPPVIISKERMLLFFICGPYASILKVLLLRISRAMWKIRNS